MEATQKTLAKKTDKRAILKWLDSAIAELEDARAVIVAKPGDMRTSADEGSKAMSLHEKLCLAHEIGIEPASYCLEQATRLIDEDYRRAQRMDALLAEKEKEKEKEKAA